MTAPCSGVSGDPRARAVLIGPVRGPAARAPPPVAAAEGRHGRLHRRQALGHAPRRGAAALELGARLSTAGGIAGFAAVTYDGIGQQDYEGVGVSLGLSFSF